MWSRTNGGLTACCRPPQYANFREQHRRDTAGNCVRCAHRPGRGWLGREGGDHRERNRHRGEYSDEHAGTGRRSSGPLLAQLSPSYTPPVLTPLLAVPYSTGRAKARTRCRSRTVFTHKWPVQQPPSLTTAVAYPGSCSVLRLSSLCVRVVHLEPQRDWEHVRLWVQSTIVLLALIMIGSRLNRRDGPVIGVSLWPAGLAHGLFAVVQQVAGEWVEQSDSREGADGDDDGYGLVPDQFGHGQRHEEYDHGCQGDQQRLPHLVALAETHVDPPTLRLRQVWCGGNSAPHGGELFVRRCKLLFLFLCLVIGAFDPRCGSVARQRMG